MFRNSARVASPLARGLAVLAAAGAVVLSTGCATVIQPVDDGLDHEKMAKVERAAQATGVRVHWVNPPRRRS